MVVHYKMPHGARLGWLKPDLLDNHSQVHEIVEVCHFTVWYLFFCHQPCIWLIKLFSPCGSSPCPSILLLQNFDELPLVGDLNTGGLLKRIHTFPLPLCSYV